jgi:low affinity Fe/Cu permease
MLTGESSRPQLLNGVKQFMSDWFRRFSRRTSQIVGSYWVFVLSVILVLVWLVTGPLFKYSNTWQLVINTTTTIITFWMCFIIQNTQNRDSRAIHLKLDELILAVKEARNEMVNVENLSEHELKEVERTIKK